MQFETAAMPVEEQRPVLQEAVRAAFNYDVKNNAAWTPLRSATRWAARLREHSVVAMLASLFPTMLSSSSSHVSFNS